MTPLITHPVLLIVDAQKGIDAATHWGGNRNNPSAEVQIETLLRAFRESNLPLVHIRHQSKNPASPFFPDQEGFQFKEMTKPLPGEYIVTKSETNAFIHTGLEQYLRSIQAIHVIIAGFVTNNSIEATARMSGNLGFKTIVLSDATAAFDKKGIDGNVYPSELVHMLSLSNLSGEYADILTTAEVMNAVQTN